MIDNQFWSLRLLNVARPENFIWFEVPSDVDGNASSTDETNGR